MILYFYFVLICSLALTIVSMKNGIRGTKYLVLAPNINSGKMAQNIVEEMTMAGRFFSLMACLILTPKSISAAAT